MDHRTADQQQAAQKYLLDELPANQRAEFEEHLFDCPLCAEQVRQDFTVVENLKEVLREQPATGAATSGLRLPANGFLAWLKPASLVPSFAALALAGIVVYQNVLPAHAPSEQAQILPAASVVTPVTRGVAQPAIKVDRAKASFVLSFMVDAAKPDSFVCDFQKEAGASVIKLAEPQQPNASFTLNVLLSSKLFPAGRYRLVLSPSSEPQNSTIYPFAIEDGK
jgi:hypothetical protein